MFGKKKIKTNNKFKVTLSGPGLKKTETFYFDPNKGDSFTLSLFINTIDCDNGGTCETTTPGTFVFDITSIE